MTWTATTAGGEYRLHALAEGVRASLSLPITARGAGAGALNLYATTPHAFAANDVERAFHFADQAAGRFS
jgi:GAF domain